MNNPYYISSDMRLDLRDARGRFSSITKAKYFYIYLDGELVIFDAFPRVSMSKSDKFEIIRQYAIAIKEEEQASPEEIEEVDEDIKEEEIEAEFEDIPLERSDKLSESLYKDLLKIVKREDPILYSEITQIPLEITGSIEEELKEILSPTQGQAAVQKETFWLDEPVPFYSHDSQNVWMFFETYLEPLVRQIYDDRIQGQDLFLFVLLYEQMVGEDSFETKGFGVARSHAPSWPKFKLLVIDYLKTLIEREYENYLKASIDGRILITGFGLENLYERF